LSSRSQERGDQADGDVYPDTAGRGPAGARERRGQQHAQAAGALVICPAGHERGCGRAKGEEAHLDNAELEQAGRRRDVDRQGAAERLHRLGRQVGHLSGDGAARGRGDCPDDAEDSGPRECHGQALGACSSERSPQTE